MKKIKTLVIPGSLRTNSSTFGVIQALKHLAPDQIELKVYDDLKNIPPFDDSKITPASVQTLLKLIVEADVLLLCTPEYAFGVPGILKNALDWTVSTPHLYEKPVSLITAATGGDKAHASLLLTLTALHATMIQDATLLISFIRSTMNDKGEVIKEETLKNLKNVLHAIEKHFETMN